MVSIIAPWETDADHVEHPSDIEMTLDCFPLDLSTFRVGVTEDEIRDALEDQHGDEQREYWDRIGIGDAIDQASRDLDAAAETIHWYVTMMHEEQGA